MNYEGEGKIAIAKAKAKYSPSSSPSIRSSRSRTAWPRTTGKAGRRSPTCIGKKVQLVGDDLFVTNSARLRDGIKMGVANSILVKVNQIGSLTETLDAVDTAHRAATPRSCRTARAKPRTRPSPTSRSPTNCGQIKTGSLARSDRTAKYNQLIRIEEELGDQAPTAGRSILKGWSAPRKERSAVAPRCHRLPSALEPSIPGKHRQWGLSVAA